MQQRGDPAHGEIVFRRKDLACLKCHAIAGAGGLAGPDLVSIGASAPIDYLIESILLPNKAVKENYHSTIVATRDGRFYTGIKVRETNEQLVLRDAEDREVIIPVKAIEERSMGGSLMPEGLADSLTRAELVDLVRFLSELGKVGPYAVSKARLARRWQVLETTREAYHHLISTRIASVTTADSALLWTPAYSRVSGDLPLDALPRFMFGKPQGEQADVLGFARCQIDVSTGGAIKLILNSTTGLALWLDSEPVEIKSEITVSLLPGIHTLTFAVNLPQRHDSLRCEFDEAPGSTVRFSVVTGK
ncbi:MAG: hypothetical protein E6K70_20100 [Planctomycetota bacterium]|nr:MAG: hypothetical protein E6K70_20100 [Planctomycetota bacterium]